MRTRMRDHLLAMQEIVLAAGSNDFAAVERAAGRMGYAKQMGQMCTHMGAGAPGFTEQALNFHHTADTITTAAKQHDPAALMRAIGSTLQSCTGCHAAFKQSVVDCMFRGIAITRFGASRSGVSEHPDHPFRSSRSLSPRWGAGRAGEVVGDGLSGVTGSAAAVGG